MNARPAALPAAGASIGARPGDVVTVAAGELGFELVNRCNVEFAPVGERTSLRGRLIKLVQPLPGGGLRELGLEEYTTLYVVPTGSTAAIPFPIPARAKVTVRVDQVHQVHPVDPAGRGHRTAP